MTSSAIALSIEGNVKLQAEVSRTLSSLSHYINHFPYQPGGFVRTEENPDFLTLKMPFKRGIRVRVNPEVRETYFDLSQDLLIVNYRKNCNPVALVLEAYFQGRIKPRYTEEVSIPLQLSPEAVSEVLLSPEAIKGIREIFGPQYRAGINAAELKRAVLVPVGDLQRDLHSRQRYPRKLSLSPDTVEHLGKTSKSLGIEPETKHGLISWASLLVEAIGRRLVRVDTPEFVVSDPGDRIIAASGDGSTAL